MSKLNPCPFCGNEYILTIGGGGYVHLHCPNCDIYFECGGTAGHSKSKEATAAAWNRRPKAEALTLEALRGMVGQWVWVKVKFQSGTTMDGWAFVATPAVVGYMDKMLEKKDFGITWWAWDREPDLHLSAQAT